MSARADVPPLCGGRSHNPRPPRSQTLLAAMAAILLLPSAVFFGALWQVFLLSFLAERAFGLVWDCSGSMELSKSRSQAGERRGGEGKGRKEQSQAQHPGNWQSGTSDHSETGFHTHGWMNKNAGTKEGEKKNTAAAIFNYRRMKPTTLH